MNVLKIKETLTKVQEALAQTEKLFYQLKGQETLLINQIKEEENEDKKEETKPE